MRPDEWDVEWMGSCHFLRVFLELIPVRMVWEVSSFFRGGLKGTPNDCPTVCLSCFVLVVAVGEHIDR